MKLKKTTYILIGIVLASMILAFFCESIVMKPMPAEKTETSGSYYRT